MLNKKLNAKLLWMQFEDVLAPRLGLTVWDRAVYSYLLRHSLVVGKLRLHFAVLSVARDLRLSNGPVRQAVRRLDELGALRLLERSKTGHIVEMRLPQQIRAVRSSRNGTPQEVGEPPASALEATDFLSTWALRKTIHDRERGACFYCLRRTPAHVQCLDHVVPRVRFGRNSYRNLVSCCIECNAQGRPSGPGFSAHALPPGTPDARRTRRTPSRLERSRRWQASPFRFRRLEGSSKNLKALTPVRQSQATGFGMRSFTDGLALLTSLVKTRYSTRVIPNPRGFGGVRDLLFALGRPYRGDLHRARRTVRKRRKREKNL
jgi:5-methylcytosine-specific restriction endonuclease McrA